MNKGNIFLLLSAIIWGFGLVAQKDGMDVMGPWSFTAVRCTLGGVSLIPLVCFLERRKISESRDYDWKSNTRSCIVPAMFCSLFLIGTIISQQYGLLYTSVGKGAFITALYIFITPLIGIFMKKRVGARMWLAVALAMAGLYMITMSGGFQEINKGDMIMLIAALSYSLFIHAADRYGEMDTIKLSCIQFLMIGVVCFPVAAFLEPGDISWHNYVVSIVPILYTGVIAAAGGYTFQMVGQKYTDANVASLILSSETVFSLLAGLICLHEILTGMEYGGCAVMVVAILIAVMPSKKEINKM